MVNIKELGWIESTVGEIDHRLLKVPSVKLRSFTEGSHGDVVFCIDLRIALPNRETLTITEMHSMEHFLLEGFRKYMPEHFISIGLMGCQTGFYLVLLNEGEAQKICSVYANILADVSQAGKVPYASISQCGNYRNHDLELARKLASRVLEARSNWMKVV